MAITYHAGRRIQGLSTDEAQTATTDENFSSSTGWTLTNTSGTYWNIASNKLNWRVDNARSGSGANYDLSSDISGVSNLDGYSKWLLRFELTLDTALGRNQDALCNFGIHDKDDFGNPPNNGDYDTSHAQVQIQISINDLANNLKRFQAIAENSDDIGQDQTMNNDITMQSKYYIEIKKTDATTYVVGYSLNPDYTTSQTVRTVTGVTLSGLKYLHFEAWEQGNNSSYESWGQGWLENLKFYPAVDTLTPRPTNVQVGSRFEETDTRKMYHYEEQVPDYDYPMTTDPRTNTFERNATYGSMTYDSTNDRILLAVDSGSGESTGSLTYIDLGSTLSSKFVLRFEHSPTGSSSYATNAHNVVGISSVAPTTYGAISSTDWIGIRWYFGTQWGSSANKQGLEPRIGENTSSNNHNNSSSVDRLYGRPNEGSNADGRFFHEFVWDNGTLTYKVYDNANYTGTVLATAILSSSSNTQWVTGTPSNVTGLRYIVFNNGSDHYYGTYNQILDNIQIWDGVTVAATGNAWKELGT